MQKSILILLILTSVIIAGGAAFYAMSPDESTKMESEMNDPVLSGEISIGAILPLSGDLSTHGEESHVAAKLAVSDFNSYLKENDNSWSLKLVAEDTATSPTAALDKLTTLNSKGISFVLGPQSSAELRLIKGYADSNGMLLISPSSTAPALAVPDDGIFRLIPSDSKQGPVVAKLVQDAGIEVLIPVWRGDTWGDGLTDATKKSFEERGGITDLGIRYHPESLEFSASASLLADKVQGYVDEYGADKVAVVLFSFAEALHIMQSASEHQVLDDVRWFGGDGNTKEEKLVTDPKGLKFSESVSFTTTQPAINDNEISQRVGSHLLDTLGRTPNSYAYSSYDAVWIIGKAILAAQSTDAATVISMIPEITDAHSGAIGSTKLNAAGDLDKADYEIFGIRGGEWVILAKYTASDDNIIYFEPKI